MSPNKASRTSTTPAPRIYLISRPTFDFHSLSEFLELEGVSWRRTEGSTSAEEVIEVSGRVCYMSFGRKQSPRTTPEYIGNLVEMGHESVLEHACWTFLVTGVSRAFSHQLVRHRVGFSFSHFRSSITMKRKLDL